MHDHRPPTHLSLVVQAIRLTFLLQALCGCVCDRMHGSALITCFLDVPVQMASATSDDKSASPPIVPIPAENQTGWRGTSFAGKSRSTVQVKVRQDGKDVQIGGKACESKEEVWTRLPPYYSLARSPHARTQCTQ